MNAIDLNTGSYLVSGLDIQGRYKVDFSGIGSLDLSVFWNHLLKQQQTPFPGGPVQDEKGQLDCYSCGRLGSGFKDKINANAVFTVKNLSLNYRLNYLGEDKRFEVYGGVNNLTDKKPPVFADTNPVTFPGTQTSADTYDLYGRMFYAGAQFRF